MAVGGWQSVGRRNLELGPCHTDPSNDPAVDVLGHLQKCTRGVGKS